MSKPVRKKLGSKTMKKVRGGIIIHNKPGALLGSGKIAGKKKGLISESNPSPAP